MITEKKINVLMYSSFKIKPQLKMKSVFSFNLAKAGKIMVSLRLGGKGISYIA
jgi:hypothetical protein